MSRNKKAILAILDGWGIGPNKEADAIYNAKTPVFDTLIKKHASATLVTYGQEVGLPVGQMGNSEVGHLNIGAGRIVYQDLEKINQAIVKDTLRKEAVIQDSIQYARNHVKPIHIIGLLSDGGVHAHIEHIKKMISIFSNAGVETIFVHAILDGRDTAPDGGAAYVQDLLDHITGTNAQLATVIGRYYAMDRDERWERIKLAYDLLINGVGEKSIDPVAAIKKSYAATITDEFMKPIIMNTNGTIKKDDLVFFANYRTDRPRQLVRALTQENFDNFEMKMLKLKMVTMTNYNKKFKNIEVVYNKDEIKNTIGEVVANAGLSQIRAAETEKYPHVTFFFSGGQETPFEKEQRILVASPKVATYDLTPEMSAKELTDKTCEAIVNDAPNFVCINYANTDMVGHTGIFEAAVKAAETVDTCLGRLLETALANGYEAIVIADHGNADCMFNPDKSPHTAHTLNPVPVVHVTNSPNNKKELRKGILADVAPTLLKIMAVKQPEEMTGHSLIT